MKPIGRCSAFGSYAFPHAQPPTPLDEAALYDYAVNALARSMRTVAQLKRLMRRKVEAGETGEEKIAAVVARLHEHRYLDDARSPPPTPVFARRMTASGAAGWNRSWAAEASRAI